MTNCAFLLLGANRHPPYRHPLNRIISAHSKKHTLSLARNFSFSQSLCSCARSPFVAKNFLTKFKRIQFLGTLLQ